MAIVRMKIIRLIDFPAGPRVRIVATERREHAMNHAIDFHGRMPAMKRGLSSRRFADRLRFVAGVAVACAGAATLFADAVRHLA
jgi:hypothetical protein